MANADVQPKTGTVTTPSDYDRWVVNLQARAVESKGDFDPSSILAQQMNRILNAENEDELDEADQGGTVAAKDFTDIGIEIQDYRLVPDDKFESQLKVFTFITVTVLQKNKKGYEVGETITLNTSAPLVIGKLEWYRSKGMLPGKKCILRSTTTRDGNEVLKLYRYEVPAAPVSAA